MLVGHELLEIIFFFFFIGCTNLQQNKMKWSISSFLYHTRHILWINTARSFAVWLRHNLFVCNYCVFRSHAFQESHFIQIRQWVERWLIRFYIDICVDFFSRVWKFIWFFFGWNEMKLCRVETPVFKFYHKYKMTDE